MLLHQKSYSQERNIQERCISLQEQPKFPGTQICEHISFHYNGNNDDTVIYYSLIADYVPGLLLFKRYNLILSSHQPHEEVLLSLPFYRLGSWDYQLKRPTVFMCLKRKRFIYCPIIWHKTENKSFGTISLYALLVVTIPIFQKLTWFNNLKNMSY